MRSNEGLDALDPDFLYRSLAIYRDDLKNMFDYPTYGWKAHAWATQTCTRIVLILARRNYDPKTKKPQRPARAAAACLKQPSQPHEHLQEMPR